MTRRKRLPKLASAKNVYKYVPGKLVLSNKEKDCGGSILNVYSFSSHLEETPSPPPIPALTIGLTHNGHRQADYKIDDEPWRCCDFTEDNICLLPAYHSVSMAWRPIEEDRARTTNLLLPMQEVLDAATKALDVEPAYIELQANMSFRDAFIKQLLLTLKSETAHEYPYGRLFFETASQLLAIHLLKNYCTVNYKVPEYTSSLSHKNLQLVTDYIHSHLHQNISLDSLAALVNMSSYHFSRLFKQSTSFAPHQYIIHCRIEKSKELLKKTNKPISQIATELGYANQSHFTRLFKQHTQMIPRVYRMSCS